MDDQHQILDDLNDVFLLSDEDILWEGRPINSDFVLAAFCIAIFLLFAIAIYFATPTLEDSSYLVICPILLLLIFTIYKYYCFRKERYWLTKEYIFIRKGMKLNIQAFPLSNIKDIGYGIHEGKPKRIDELSIYFKQKVPNNFSWLNMKITQIKIGPLRNTNEIAEKIKREINFHNDR